MAPATQDSWVTIAVANIPHLELFSLYSKRALTRSTLLELRKCSTPMIIGTTNLIESQPSREQEASANKLRGAQKIQPRESAGQAP